MLFQQLAECPAFFARQTCRLADISLRLLHQASQVAALELLDRLQRIENAQGRVRGERWGARCIDLDILLYGDRRIEHERLQVPHPGLHLREFVLYPLQRLDDSLRIPGHGKLRELLQQCPRNGIEYLGMIEEKLA